MRSVRGVLCWWLCGLTVVPAFAQVPTCELAPQFDLHYSGADCGDGNPPCVPGELITFFALPYEGSFSGCESFTWNFGDGSPEETGSTPMASHAFAVAQRRYIVQVVATSDRGSRTEYAIVSTHSDDASRPSGTDVPRIGEFTASPPRVTRGQEVLLEWTTSNTNRVKIEPLNVTIVLNNGDVSGFANGSYTFIPQQTGTYTLYAYGRPGFTARDLTIVVDPAAPAACEAPPNLLIEYTGLITGCKQFDPPCAPGELIAFRATSMGRPFADCDSFAWDFGDGVEASGRMAAHAFAASPVRHIVRLQVNNEHGKRTDYAVVSTTTEDASGTLGTDLPRISRFTATPARVVRGQPVVLAWETMLTNRVKIEPADVAFVRPDGTVVEVESGQYTIFPRRTETYTLVAYGRAGFTAREVTIVVTPPTRVRAVRR